MKQLRLYIFLLLFSLFFSISCSEKEEEQQIATSELPVKITSAIQDTLPGFIIAKAEIETTENKITYEIEGFFKEKEYEIEISSDGKIIEIEEENLNTHDKDQDADEHDNEDID